MKQIVSHLRLPAIAVAALVALVWFAPAASGASPTGGANRAVSSTENFHGTMSFQDVNPCNGDTLNIVTETNSVAHITTHGDEVWATFTESDKVTATDTGTGVVYTGHATFWGNFNLNERNENSTFTGTIMVRGSDGSTISYHEVDHYALNANGDLVVSFEKPRVTCG